MTPNQMFGNPDYIRWDPKFEIGIPVIDEQHKKLVELCNRFYQELLQNKAEGNPPWDQSLRSALHECVDYVKTHFKNEETLMTACSYPNFAEHKKMHDMFIKNILETTNGFQEATIGVAFKFVKFLYDWILSHIAHEDKLYVKDVLGYYRKMKAAQQ